MYYNANTSLKVNRGFLFSQKGVYCFLSFFKRRKIMKKRLLSTLLVGALAVVSLFGCGETQETEQPAAQETVDEQNADAAETAEAAEAESTEATDAEAVIKIAASPTPHAEILAKAKDILKEQGIDLQITEFEDYVLPMTVVESGELDANYAVHVPYLEQFNEEQGTHLANAGGIHYEPFGIYPGTKSDLADIAEGDTIAVPNDTTNEARALLLLEDNGLIKLKEGAGLTATVNDIEENPNNIKFEELEAAQVPRVKDEVAFIVLNGNYALEAGLSVGRDSIAFEANDSTAAKTYVNIIAVKEGNESNPSIQALVEVLKSDEIKNFINETFDGAVVPFE